ncbi:hypothetical protein C8039_03780 [Halogeometricum sp. wsp3]|nr:hypothetical protein C8039_03780 [Halogeometricum sp. wsp3]
MEGIADYGNAMLPSPAERRRQRRRCGRHRYPSIRLDGRAVVHVLLADRVRTRRRWPDADLDITVSCPVASTVDPSKFPTESRKPP